MFDILYRVQNVQSICSDQGLPLQWKFHYNPSVSFWEISTERPRDGETDRQTDREVPVHLLQRRCQTELQVDLRVAAVKST